jgi:hypothetical protein
VVAAESIEVSGNAHGHVRTEVVIQTSAIAHACTLVRITETADIVRAAANTSIHFLYSTHFLHVDVSGQIGIWAKLFKLPTSFTLSDQEMSAILYVVDVACRMTQLKELFLPFCRIVSLPAHMSALGKLTVCRYDHLCLS